MKFKQYLESNILNGFNCIKLSVLKRKCSDRYSFANGLFNFFPTNQACLNTYLAGA